MSKKKRSNSSATVQSEQPLSVSQSDLLDSSGVKQKHHHNLSRSFDARSLGFLSLSMSAASPEDEDQDPVQQRHGSKSSSSVFSRSTRSRHSADQYLPMTGAPSSLLKVSVSFFFNSTSFSLLVAIFLFLIKKWNFNRVAAESTAKTAEKVAGCVGSL